MSKTVAATEPAREATTEKLTALMRRADRGDAKAISALREIFHSQPSLWEDTGNLARHAEAALVWVAAGENQITEQAIRRKLATMRRELAGPAPTPLEHLLVERVVACWLWTNYLDAMYAQALKTKGMSWESSEYHQRRQDRAQRRYLEAIRTLAQVRRLLAPAVQVNIAEQQIVNVGP